MKAKKVVNILYSYTAFADGTEVLHTQLLEKTQGAAVEVHFERPVDDGFCTARCELPSGKWLICEGFSHEEIQMFEAFLRVNSSRLLKRAGE